MITKRKLTRLGAPLALYISALGAWSASAASPFAELPGRWSGWGSVVMSNGSSEQVKCVATYFLQNGGDGVQQNLRCASSNYKIDATASFLLKGTQVTGVWEEKTWSATGDVTGKFNGNAFDLSIRGPHFSAAMAVTTTSCKQSISIAPTGFDISKITIGLGKC
jgi:hypothetical protein